MRKTVFSAVAVVLIFSAIYTVHTQAVDVSDIKIINRHVLDYTGFSADLALSPVDGSLHMMWVRKGDMRYLIRDNDKKFGEVQVLDDGSRYVYGERKEWPRKCLDFAIDPSGKVHIVFGDSSGGIYYMHGIPDFNGNGQWSAPLRVAKTKTSNIYPNILFVSGDLYVIYENPDIHEIFEVSRIDGYWDSPKLIDYGGYPQLVYGQNGMIYLLYRNFRLDSPDYFAHDPVFSYKVPGFTGWIKSGYASRAGRRSGIGPYMTVGNGNIYVAWNNSTGLDGPEKAELFCAYAPEPGLNWVERLGQDEPLYHEDTGDPHGRVMVYSDGTVLFFNSRRMLTRFMTYSQNKWSGPFDERYENRSFFDQKMWHPGITFAVNNGRTVWIISSSSREESDMVSLTGLVNSNAEIWSLNNHKPCFTTFPDTITAPGMKWSYSAHAEDTDGDPLHYSLTLPVEGMRINNITGLAEWSPNTDQKGIYLVGIKADDRRGGWSAQYFRLTVDDISVSFSAAPLAGEAPLQVQFTDESSGNINKWEWDFGDGFAEGGGSGDEQHPVYTYENPGTYTVRLTIYGEGFVFSEEKEDYITVSAQTSVETDGASVPVFALLPNYPNPFNPQTIIPFQVGSQSRVNISIYDLLGRKVKTLVDAVFSAGRHQTLWDGSDMNGKDAANGLYFYIMRADNFKSARKAFLLK